MKMKKTYIFALVATALITALSACSNIDYNGEYSKDGYFCSCCNSTHHCFECMQQYRLQWRIQQRRIFLLLLQQHSSLL